MDFIKKDGMLEINFTKKELLKHGLSPKDLENVPSKNLEKFIMMMLRTLESQNLLQGFTGPYVAEAMMENDNLKIQLKKLSQADLPKDVREIIGNIIGNQPDDKIDQKSPESVTNEEITFCKGYWFYGLNDAVEAAERLSCFSSRLLHTEFFKDPKTEMFFLWMEIKKEEEESLNGFMSLMLEYSQKEAFPELERAHLHEHGKLMIKENVFEKLAYLAS